MEPLTKKVEKLVRSLQQKKFRKQEGLFIVEGKKMVEEALRSNFKVRFIVVDQEINFSNKSTICFLTDKKMMEQLSTFKTPPGILAVIETKEDREIESTHLTLVLDRVQDPGNLGTIIRTADAFGIKTLVCSKDTVEHLSPKVIQATMGSIFRVNVHYLELKTFLEQQALTTPLYAAHLDGDDLYQTKLEGSAVVIMGNESQGISDNLITDKVNKIKIPIAGEAESFNVSIATAIILSEFKRQNPIV